MRVAAEPTVEIEVNVCGAGPTLICIHGFGGAKEDFADHVDALAEHWQVVTLDLRGHGDSDAPGDAAAYSLYRMARDIDVVADAVGADRFALLGHSMGGMIARRVALQDPCRVDALVLMSTAAGPPKGIDSDLVDFGAQLALDDWVALKMLLDDSRALGTPAYERLLAERPGFAEFVEWKWSRVAPVMWAAIAPQVVREPDGLDALRALECPALVMVGDLDAAFYEASLAMADVIPQSRLTVIEAAGHHPQFEQPDAWRNALTTFLAEVAPRVGVEL
jgi:3-oxoadipate enol-lactonase